MNPLLELFTIDELLELNQLDIARAIDERIEAEVAAAKFRPAEDDALLDARVEEASRKADRFIQAMQDVDAPPEDWLALQRKRQAAAIRCEIAARAAELKQQGVRAPTAQAREEVAKRYGRASGLALKKWLVRNR